MYHTLISLCVSWLIEPFQEFYKDPNTGKLNIVVSLSTGSYGPFLPYVFTANDNSLTSWSGPVVMSGISNAGLGYIDSFPVFFKCVAFKHYSTQRLELMQSIC